MKDPPYLQGLLTSSHRPESDHYSVHTYDLKSTPPSKILTPFLRFRKKQMADNLKSRDNMIKTKEAASSANL